MDPGHAAPGRDSAARRIPARAPVLSRRADRSPWAILGMAVAMQFGVSLIDQGILTLTGFIKLDLGLSAFTTGLIVASFALGRIGGAYMAGLAADKLGEHRTLLVGGSATAAIVLLAAFSPLPVLIPMLVLAGAAGASATPAGGRLVLLAFPRNRRGFALGIRQTGIPAAGRSRPPRSSPRSRPSRCSACAASPARRARPSRCRTSPATATCCCSRSGAAWS